MPFKSEKQRRFLWLKHPDLAKRWAHEYPDSNKGLPMYAHKSKEKEKEAVLAVLMTEVKNINNSDSRLVNTGSGPIVKNSNSKQEYIDIPHSDRPTYAGEERLEGEQKDLDSDNTLPDRNRGEASTERGEKPKENAINALLQKISLVVAPALLQQHENHLAEQEGRFPAQIPQNAGIKNYPRAQAGIPLPMGMQQQPAQPAQQPQAKQPASPTSAPPVGQGGNPMANPIQSFGALSANGNLNGNAAFGTKNSPLSSKSAAVKSVLAKALKYYGN